MAHQLQKIEKQTFKITFFCQSIPLSSDTFCSDCIFFSFLFFSFFVSFLQFLFLFYSFFLSFFFFFCIKLFKGRWCVYRISLFVFICFVLNLICGPPGQQQTNENKHPKQPNNCFIGAFRGEMTPKTGKTKCFKARFHLVGCLCDVSPLETRGRPIFYGVVY